MKFLPGVTRLTFGAVFSTAAFIVIGAQLQFAIGADDSAGAEQYQTRTEDNRVGVQRDIYEEVPVQTGTPSGGSGNAPEGAPSPVAVSAASPQDNPAGGHWNCWVEEISDFNKTGHCTLLSDDTPADPAPAAPAPAPIVLTSHDVATLIVDGSGITLQPPGATVLLHMPLIAYTNPTTRTLTTSVGGTAVDVEVTPATYTWNWGDGTTFSTTDPGNPYPNQSVTHLYAATADNVVVSLTTTWTARFKPSGAADWQPVDGYVTTTQSAPPFNIRRLIPYLSDDAEEHQGH